MQRQVEESLNLVRQLQDAKGTLEHEHSNLQQLHQQLMAELEQRDGQVPQVQTSS